MQCEVMDIPEYGNTLYFRSHHLNPLVLVLTVCFEGCVAVMDGTETGNELSQPTFKFTSLFVHGIT